MNNEIRPKSDGTWPEIPFNTIILVSLGNATAWHLGIFAVKNGKCLVAIERKGAFSFNVPDWLHWNYVAEKLNLLEGDAANIADLLNSQLAFNWRNEKYIKQGYYNPRFCSDYEEKEEE